MFIGFLLEPSIVVTVLEPSIVLSFAGDWIPQPILSFAGAWMLQPILSFAGAWILWWKCGAGGPSRLFILLLSRRGPSRQFILRLSCLDGYRRDFLFFCCLVGVGNSGLYLVCSLFLWRCKRKKAVEVNQRTRSAAQSSALGEFDNSICYTHHILGPRRSPSS